MSPAQPTLFVMVTCSLDASRAAVLEKVAANVVQKCVTVRPTMLDDLLVIDNASTVPGTRELLASCFRHVHAVDRNVGYWTAVDWALAEGPALLGRDDYRYVYVIESDMLHYAFERLPVAECFLACRPDIGGVRCQEYSVEHQRLYDKERPRGSSRRWAWQSHTHFFTQQPIVHSPSGVLELYETSFLTQLPALNRIDVVRAAFDALRARRSFSEHDFQRECFERHPTNALLDGGIYHARLGTDVDGPCVTGSWSSQAVLQTTGYRATRTGWIDPPGTYRVTRVA